MKPLTSMCAILYRLGCILCIIYYIYITMTLGVVCLIPVIATHTRTPVSAPVGCAVVITTSIVHPAVWKMY